MKIIIQGTVAVLFLGVVLAFVAFPQSSDKSDKKEKVKATVEKIDHGKGTLTLKGPKGNLVTVKAGDKADKVNFGQIKKGDTIVTEFYGEGAFVDVQRDTEGNWVLKY